MKIEEDIESFLRGYFRSHGKLYGLLVDDKGYEKKFNWKKLNVERAIDLIFKFDKEFAKTLSEKFKIRGEI